MTTQPSDNRQLGHKPEAEERPCPPWVDDNPRYWPAFADEFKHPVAECVRPIPDKDEEAMQRLTIAPKFSKSELEVSANKRILLPERLFDAFMPIPEHLEIYYSLYRLIMGSYRSPGRNPLTPEGQYLLHYGPSKCPITIKPGTISLFEGLSGTGKSVLVRISLACLSKPVIRHHSYNGHPFTETQIPYLLRDASAQGSLKAFAQIYGTHTDNLLGYKFYGPKFSDPRQNRTTLTNQLKTIIANHYVGAILIDIAENLTVPGPDGLHGFETELESIRDEYGTSIILIATYALGNKLRKLKRCSLWRKIEEGGGPVEFQRATSVDDPRFLKIAKPLWGIQWLRDPSEFDEEIAATLYQCSAGITGVLVPLLVIAQLQALQMKIEKIDAAFLTKVYQAKFKPLHEVLDALRLPRKDILNQFDDLYAKGMREFLIDNPSMRLAMEEAERKRALAVGSDPHVGDETKKSSRPAKTGSETKKIPLSADRAEMERFMTAVGRTGTSPATTKK